MKFPVGVASKTLVAEDNNALLTNLGALRKVCAGHNVRADMSAFLRTLEDYPDDLAVYVDPSGPKLVRDDSDELLQWVERKGEAG
jgi:hypothetical protein